MDEEIKNILSEIKDGEKVLKYIDDLEEQIEELEEEIYELEDDVNDLEKESEQHHHHDENCTCGCHDHHEEEDEWEEIKTPYKNELTVKDWEKLLKEPEIFTVDALKVMKRMRHIAAPTSPMELADMFGFGAMYYKSEIENLTKRLAEKLNVNDLDKEYYWSLLLDGWKNKNTEEEIYALKQELYEAIGNVDLSNIPLRENEV